MSGINTPTYKVTKNAGNYKYRISIYQIVDGKDSDGFPVETKSLILQPYAAIKTTRGMTIIANNSDFEKAYTRFMIRFSSTVLNAYYEGVNSNRDMIIEFRNKSYKVEYLNNVDEMNVEIELQCKEILK
jgi:head-tail adaptor